MSAELSSPAPPPATPSGPRLPGAAASFAALAWLDAHLLVNRIHVIFRSPRRLLPWLLLLAWLAPSYANRLAYGSRLPAGAYRPPPLVALEQLGALIPGLALGLLGLLVWRAAGRAPAAFSSPADGRFLVAAGMSPRVVLSWLAFRRARRLAYAAVVYTVLLTVVFLPGLGLAPDHAFVAAAGLALFLGLLFAGSLASFVAGQLFAPALPRAAAALLIALGTASVAAAATPLLGLETAVPGSVLRLAQTLPVGGWLLSAFAGDGLADLYLAGLAVLLLGAALAGAGDCFPELWTASSRLFVARRALRQSGGGLVNYARLRRDLRAVEGRAATTREVASASGRRVPGGAWTLAWKEWLTLTRSRGGLALQAAFLAGALLAGTAAGLMSSHGHRGPATMLVAYLGFAVLISSAFFGIRMGADLRNPLWWLNDSALWRRLTAWMLARTLRFALPVIVLLEALVLTGRQPRWLVAAIPGAVFLVCALLQVVALASYALLPAMTDYRVAQMLRLLVVYLVVVTLLVAAAPALILRSLVALVLGPSLLALGEVAALIAFASWRIQGNGLAFAREEQQ